MSSPATTPNRTPSRLLRRSLSKLSIDLGTDGESTSPGQRSRPSSIHSVSSIPTPSSMNVPTTQTTPNKLRKRSDSTNEGSTSKRASLVGMVRRTKSKIMGGGASSSRNSEEGKSRPVTPSQAPPTPPPSSRATPTSTPISRIPRPSHASKLSNSSNSSLNNDVDSAFAENAATNPISQVYSVEVDVVTPPKSMSIQMEGGAAKEYFADVESVREKEEGEDKKDDASIAVEDNETKEDKVQESSKEADLSTDTVKVDEETEADAKPPTEKRDPTPEPTPQILDTPIEEELEELSEEEMDSILEKARAAVDEKPEEPKPEPTAQDEQGKPAKTTPTEVAEEPVQQKDKEKEETKVNIDMGASTGSLSDSFVRVDPIVEVEEEKEDNQVSKAVEEDNKQAEENSVAPQEEKGGEKKEDRSFTEEEDKEDEEGRKAIEEARRTLEELDKKPTSPHGDPLSPSRQPSYSHIPTAQSASRPTDDDASSLVSDVHHPRVSETISRIEEAIETSSTVVSPVRERTHSSASMRSNSAMNSPHFRRESSDFGLPPLPDDEDFEPTSPGEKRSRRYSITSTATVASSRMDQSFDRSYSSMFTSSPNSASVAGSVFGDSMSTSGSVYGTPTPDPSKRRKTSSIISMHSPTGDKNAKRFASPTFASQTREYITKKTYEEKRRAESQIPRMISRKVSGQHDKKGRLMPSTPSHYDRSIGLKDEGVDTADLENSMMDASIASLESVQPNDYNKLIIHPNYTSTATQTEYPSPPSSPFSFRSLSPLPSPTLAPLAPLEPSDRSNRPLEFESFQQSIDDAANMDNKMATLLAIFDDAKVVEDLVESMESSMELLEGTFRASTPPRLGRLGSAGSAGKEPLLLTQGLGESKTEEQLRAEAAAVKAAAEDVAAVILAPSASTSTSSPPTGVAPTDPATIPTSELVRTFASRQRWNIIFTLLAVGFFILAYYMQLVRIHRRCGFADTYVCVAGGKVCAIRPYSCY